MKGGKDGAGADHHMDTSTGHAGILGNAVGQFRGAGAGGTDPSGNGGVLFSSAAPHRHRCAERGGSRRPAGISVQLDRRCRRRYGDVPVLAADRPEILLEIRLPLPEAGKGAEMGQSF